MIQNNHQRKKHESEYFQCNNQTENTMVKSSIYLLSF